MSHTNVIVAGHENQRTNRPDLSEANTRGHGLLQIYTTGGHDDHDRSQDGMETQGQPRTRKRSVSFLTEVPAAQPGLAPDDQAVSHHGRVHRDDVTLARHAPGNETFPGGGGNRRLGSVEPRTVDGTNAPQQPLGEVPTGHLPLGSGHALAMNAGYAPATEEVILQGAGTRDGGIDVAESASPPGLDHDKGLSERETAVEHAPLAHPSRADGSPREEDEEEGALTGDDIMSSWSSMVAQQYDDQLEDRLSASADEPPAWGGYVSDSQPERPPETIGPPSGNDSRVYIGVHDDVEIRAHSITGAGSADSSVAEAGNFRKEGRHLDKSSLPVSGEPTGTVGAERGDRTSESPPELHNAERMMQVRNSRMERGWSQKKGQRVSGGKVRVAQGAAREGGRGDEETNEGLLRLDDETAGGALVAAREASLNAEGGELRGSNEDRDSSEPVTALHNLVPSEQPNHDGGDRKTGSANSTRLLLTDNDGKGGIADGGRSSALSESASSASVAETAQLHPTTLPSELAPLDQHNFEVSNEPVMIPVGKSADLDSDDSRKPHQAGDLHRETDGGVMLEQSAGGSHGRGSTKIRSRRRSSITSSSLKVIDERACREDGGVQKVGEASAEVLPLQTRRSLGAPLVPELEPDAEIDADADRNGNGNPDDVGDEEGEEDDGENWASWLGAAGGG